MTKATTETTKYRPVRMSCSNPGEMEYGPMYDTDQEAELWIQELERRTGCTPEWNGGYGMGSGFYVDVV